MSFSSTPLTPLSTPPPQTSTFILSYPAPAILIVTINRPKAMNSIPSFGHWEADSVFKWFDNEPSLRVAIITGVGDKAFCAGQDLIELNSRRSGGSEVQTKDPSAMHPTTGFAGVSRRVGYKPIIAAVNGFALGGGFEICLNCDLVVAAPTASFGLPEATRGIYAAAGGLPRVMRTCGLQIASEIALTGRRLSAQEARSYGLINRIAQSAGGLLAEAVELAEQIAAISPDAILVTRQGLREAWETASVERATQVVAERWSEKLMRSENTRIGLEAFARKQKPNWVPSKL